MARWFLTMACAAFVLVGVIGCGGDKKAEPTGTETQLPPDRLPPASPSK
jgi:hypothetical protein